MCDWLCHEIQVSFNHDMLRPVICSRQKSVKLIINCMRERLHVHHIKGKNIKGSSFNVATNNDQLNML